MTADEPHNEPRPMPRPGPRPGPRRHPAPTPTKSPVPPASDPHRFGRVDDDGTVWLITSAGERVIGSWQAGDPEAAFAHFGRRFDDLSTEVTLMEERLASGTGDARKIKAAAAALAETLPTAPVLGDVDALAARLTAIVEHADAAAAAERPRATSIGPPRPPARRRWPPRPRSWPPTRTQWKAAGDRLRAILDEWKTISGLDRKTDDALWKRYSAARETFNRRRGSHFAELDRERVGARQAKEAAVRARRRARPTRPTGRPPAPSSASCSTEWKAAGRAAKDVDDALWRRFKAAQDTFFKARNAVNAERDAELQANATAKEALLAEAEKLDTSNHDAARAALRIDRRQVGRDRQGAPRTVGRPGAAAARGREEGARRRRRRAGPTRRRRPGPSNSASAPSSSNARPRRPRRRAAARKPRRPGPTPSSGGSGLTPPRRR